MTNRDDFLDVDARLGVIADAVMAGAGCSTTDAERIAIAVVAEDPSRNGLIPGYSEALDRIYDLRHAAVYEARIIEVHLQLAGFPKTHRLEAQHAVDALRKATTQFNAANVSFKRPSQVDGQSEQTAQRETSIADTLAKEGLAADVIPGIVEAVVTSPKDQWPHYLAATQEVAALCGIISEHSDVIRAALTYKTFPKSRRAIAEKQAERMRLAGDVQRFEEAYADLNRWHAQQDLRAAGAQALLTRASWETNRAVPAA